MSQLNSSWQFGLMSYGSLRPSDRRDSTCLKKGRDRSGERWQLIIFLEEARHKEFITHGAKSIWWRRKENACQISKLCVQILHEKLFYIKAQDRGQSPCILAWGMFPQRLWVFSVPLLMDLVHFPACQHTCSKGVQSSNGCSTSLWTTALCHVCGH